MNEAPTAPETSSRAREIRYKQAALLIEKWLAEESEYDHQTWEQLEGELRESAMTCEAADESSP